MFPPRKSSARQRRVLLLLWQFQVLLAEEAEPWAFRAVLAARVAAAHIPLQSPEFPPDPVPWGTTRRRQRRGDAIGEDLSKPLSEKIERM